MITYNNIESHKNYIQSHTITLNHTESQLIIHNQAQS